MSTQYQVFHEMLDVINKRLDTIENSLKEFLKPKPKPLKPQSLRDLRKKTP